MIIAILQARMSSTRFPGKIMETIDGIPMLLYQIKRISKSKFIDKLIVATTSDATDDIIVELCKDNNISFYRGSITNVLERFYNIATLEKPLHIVRLTGDCPLIDPLIIDKVIENHLTFKDDYTSNTIFPTYPDGMDVEIMTYSTLMKVYENAKRASLKEHVTLYINENKNLFKIANVENKINQSHFRLTVDEVEDLELIKLLLVYLSDKENFTLDDIINVFKLNPKLLEINNRYKRNEGLHKSLTEEIK